MKLNIPKLGDILVLAEDWTFNLANEYRNYSLYSLFELEDVKGNGKEVTLPKGSKLKVDRIYIRKGQSDYNSVSFFLVGEKTSGKTLKRKWTEVKDGKLVDSGYYELKYPSRGVRFFASLDDANNIVYE